MIDKTAFFSWKVGKLCKGCKLCVNGLKTVLFITGLCSKKEGCYYCPIADDRRGVDVIYANERAISNIDELYEEINLCGSKGVGITGGDPLMRLNRTVEYITGLKKRYGKEFHIHLYCPIGSVSLNSLSRLHEAGLDEIRFHLDLENEKEWGKINLAKRFRWKIGVEIPVIPHKKEAYNKLIKFVRDKIHFFNLNELELADNESSKLFSLGFVPKDEFSYAIKGSEELALDLLKRCEDLNTHYCTVKLKDLIQIPNRLKNRLKKVKAEFDEVKGFSLIRGAIYLRELKPDFGYRKLLAKTKNREGIIKQLEELKDNLIVEFKIKKSLMKVDPVKLRILTSRKIVKQFSERIKKLSLIPAIVEELPSYDQFETEIEFI